ncbi:MAG: MMPL family transporter [Acidobacteriota bacterium]
MSETLDQRVTRAARWLIRWRWPVLVVTVLAVAAVASGARHLGFATSYRVFFSESNPELLAFDAMHEIYSKNDNILFVVTPEDGEVFTPATLAAVEEITEKAWQVPASSRVDSITNFQHTWADADDLIVEDLVTGAEDLTAEQLARIRSIALERPELVGRLISPDGDVTGVSVTVQLSGEDPKELIPPVSFARQLAAEIEEAHPGIEVRLSGVVMLNNAFVEAGEGDLSSVIPLMYLVLIAVMVLLLRSFSGTFATVVLIGMSAAVAMGVTGFSGTHLTPVSVQSITMILTLAIADSIHVLVSMFQEMRGGTAKREALVEAIRINFLPVLLTSVTTAIGFLSLNFSDSPPLQHLGNITAVGVIAAFVLSMTLLPALMAILPVRVKVRAARSKAPFFERLGDFVVARRHWMLWGAVALIIATVSFVPSNVISDRFIQYFDDSIEFRQHTDYAVQNLTGVYQLDFSLESGETGGISSPEYLATVDRFTEWFRAQPDVLNVSALTDTMKRLNMNMHGDDPAYLRLPENRELAAQYLLLYEMSLPFGLDLNNQINVDKSSTRLLATVGDMPTNEYLALAGRAEEWLANNAPPEMMARATGPTTMFANITKRNIESMIFGTSIAFLLISLVLMVTLRSWKIGLLSIIPNAVPAAMAFGAWGLLVGEVGFAVSVVAAMTLGVVVDDSIHFLTKYLRARREKELDAAGAVRYAFRSVGQALWVTSAVLTAGFLILAQSSFKQNSDLGLLAAVTIVVALVADFTLLPALLMWIDGDKGKARKGAAAESAHLDPGVAEGTA